MNLIKELTNDALNYINSNEGYQVLTHSENGITMHSQKLPREIRDFYQIHPDKMAHEILHQLRKFDMEGWLHVNEGFANFYMTLLTNRICEQYNIAPLTDNTYTSNLSNLAKLDNQVAIHNSWDYPCNVQHLSNTRNQFAQGILLDISFEGITISDEVSIDDILKFKRQHQDELGLFRQNIERLTQNIPVNATIEQIRQQVKDIYVNQFLPEYNNLKRSLEEEGIRTIVNNFIKISFFSTSATSLPAALLGMPIPSALLAGAGISIISTLFSYNLAKQNILRNNPYSYLLSINKGI